jgi:hypothetical protein
MERLSLVGTKMTRAEVEMVMGPPTVVTKHPLATHIDVLTFQANGACEVQIDCEIGWVVSKGWGSQRPTSEWVLVWRWLCD